MSTGTEYGKANDNYFGHVKLSNTYNTPIGGVIEGVGASQHAVYNMWNASNIRLTSLESNILGVKVIDAMTGTVSVGVNFGLKDASFYIVTAQQGLGNSDCGVWIIHTRDQIIYTTPLKTMTLFSIRTSGLTLGVYLEPKHWGLCSCVKI